MENTLANVDLGRYRRIVQMFWDPEPSNDPARDLPVWCLGRSYKLDEGKLRRSVGPRKTVAPTGLPSQEASINASEVEDNKVETPQKSHSSSVSSSLAYEDDTEGSSWPQGFLDDFESRIWMTYRSDFDPIRRSEDPKAISALSLSMRVKAHLGGDSSGFSSDSGWGCMIRSGQSLLANTLSILKLGRDWRRGDQPAEEKALLRLFADDPAAPYSIHKFVQHGEGSCGKYPGEWFGPSATARCIQALANAKEASLRVYSTGDGPDVYEDRLMEIAKGTDGCFRPTLILVGTRLGIDKVTPVYWEALIAALQMTQSVGIAGGRPSSSHYFVGAQGSFLFYLDPHHTRRALPYHADSSRYTEEEVASCHTARLRRLHVREMDPSMLVGFLIRSEADWQEWKQSVKHVQGKAIIHISPCDPTQHGVGGSDCRAEAIDEVETLSDDEEEEEKVAPPR